MRALIKKSAAVGAAAWTAPVILGSLASPAAAGTCAKGSFYVAYQTSLAELFPNVTANSCSAPTGTNAHPSAVGLTATFSGTCTGTLGTIVRLREQRRACQPVTLTIGSCVCQLHHHRRAGPRPQSWCRYVSERFLPVAEHRHPRAAEDHSRCDWQPKPDHRSQLHRLHHLLWGRWHPLGKPERRQRLSPSANHLHLTTGLRTVPLRPRRNRAGTHGRSDWNAGRSQPVRSTRNASLGVLVGAGGRDRGSW